jgi:DinB family protein
MADACLLSEMGRRSEACPEVASDKLSPQEVLMVPQAQFAWESLEFRTPAMLRVVAALPEAAIRWRPPNGANTVAWLLWHIAEVEDDWVRDKVYGQPRRYPFGVSVRGASLESYPTKSELLAYFHEVRALTRARLEETTEEGFERTVEDSTFGTLTVRQLWGGVVTSFAWHAGQISFLNRLIPAELKTE